MDQDLKSKINVHLEEIIKNYQFDVETAEDFFTNIHYTENYNQNGLLTHIKLRVPTSGKILYAKGKVSKSKIDFSMSTETFKASENDSIISWYSDKGVQEIGETLRDYGHASDLFNYILNNE